MNKGFGDSKKTKKKNVESSLGITVNGNEVDKLLKDYKKLKKYMNSSIYTLKVMDNSETIISNLVGVE